MRGGSGDFPAEAQSWEPIRTEGPRVGNKEGERGTRGRRNAWVSALGNFTSAELKVAYKRVA